MVSFQPHYAEMQESSNNSLLLYRTLLLKTTLEYHMTYLPFLKPSLRSLEFNEFKASEIDIKNMCKFTSIPQSPIAFITIFS